MGSRGRSIRLRIYFLVAIPLIAMVGLLAYVAEHHGQQRHQPGPGAGPDQRDLAADRRVHQGPPGRARRRGGLPVPAHPAEPGGLRDRGQGVPGLPAEVPGRHELAGHQEQRGRRRGRGHQGHRRRPGQLQGLRGGVTGRALTPLQALGALQRRHPERAPAVPGRGEQPDQRRRRGPGPRADRDRVRPGGAVAGVRAAVRDAGRAAEHARPTGRPSPRWSPPGRATSWTPQSVLNQTNLAIFLKQVNNDEQTQLAGIETAVTAGTPVTKLPVTLDAVAGADGQAAQRVLHRRRQRRAAPSWPTTTRSAGRRGPGWRSPAASACSGCSSPSR